MAFKKRHVLPSAAWVNGGNIQIPVKDLPPLSRIEAFVFRLEGVFTAGAAAALIASTQLHRLIQMLDIGPNVHGSGAFFHQLRSLMRGGESFLPAAIPATNNGVFRRHITWTVPFADFRAESPYDGCPAGADFNEKVISIDTAAFASLGAGTWSTLASITGTLRVEAILAPPNNKPASIVQFGTADLTGQAPMMVGTALYEDLFLMRESMATIDSTQVATVQIAADGQPVTDQVRLSELVSRFNEIYASGSDIQASSATDPEGWEVLPEAPAYADGAADTVTVPVLPILFPPRNHKKSHSLMVDQTLRIDFTGSDTSFRVGYRRVLPHTESSIKDAFARRGIAVGSLEQVASAPKSGRALSPRKSKLARFLPVQAKR